MRYSEFPFQKINIDEFSKTIDSLITDFDKSDNAGSQFEVIKEFNGKLAEVSTFQSMAHLNFSRNVKNEQAKANNEYYDQINPSIEGLEVKFKSAVLKSPFKEELENLCGSHYFKLMEVKLLSFEDKLKPLMVEENKLINEYMALLAKAEIEFQGKKVNLSGIRGFFRDKDRTLRKESMFKHYDYFNENAEELDDIYSRMVELRHKMATQMGYDNYVDLAYKRLSRTDYNSKDVAFFREEIQKHIIPKTKIFADLKIKELGLDNLKVYDGVYFKDGNPRPKGSHDEMVAWTHKMYNELSPQTGEFFNILDSEELFDLKTRDGKTGGGFCTSFPSMKRPYIFANFNGSAHDVTVLTHEFGHAFQCYNSRDYQLLDYQWPTYEACEIHSMSMEFLTWPWMDLFFKEDSERFKFSHLADSIHFLPYGALVDHFQHEVYQNPGFSAQERKKLWLELEKVYRPNLDYDGHPFLESGGLWQGQGHIYFMPFYYIDYTLAQTCAFQFWMEYQRDPKATWEKYFELCKLGGSMSFLDLVKAVNIRSPFEKDVLKDASAAVMDWLSQKQNN